MDRFEDAVHEHLSATLLALAHCVVDAGPIRQGELVDVARLLTLAQQVLSQPLVPVPTFSPAPDGESDDERIERKADEAAARTRAMLDRMNLTDGERQFAQDTGERIVDLVTEAYLSVTRRGPPLDGAVITAAAAVALLIVHDAG